MKLAILATTVAALGTSVGCAHTCRQPGQVLEGQLSDGGVERVCTYPDGRKEGRYVRWYANGHPAERGQYRRGARHGQWQGWHEDGTPAWRGTFHTGRQHGMWFFYHPGGALAEKGKYSRGVRHGTWMAYYPEGTLMSIGKYHRGRPHGWWKTFYPNGALERETLYRRGQPTGRERAYTPDGHMELAEGGPVPIAEPCRELMERACQQGSVNDCVAAERLFYMSQQNREAYDVMCEERLSGR